MNTKLTFTEMQNKVQTAKHNSDLENLAHAMEYISAGRIELNEIFQERMKEFSELETKITKLATDIESGITVHLENVSELYNKARKTSNVSL